MTELQEPDLFEQKFDSWNKKLLDLSRRNRLLNYRQRKVGTYQLEGAIEEVYQQLVDGNGFVYEVIPDLFEDDAEIQAVKERARKLEYIRKQIKSAEDEMGFNIGYAAFGMLEWGERNSFDKQLISPLVLVPIQIQRKNLSSSISVSLSDDGEITINPVIAKKLLDDFGISLDEHFQFVNVREALDYIKELTSKFGWEISETVVIDTFNFQNLVIQKDLEKNKERIHKNLFIRALVGEPAPEVEKIYEMYNEVLLS